MGRSSNLAVKLGHPVALGLVKPHGGPHALIATVIAASPTWKPGTKGERTKVKGEFGSQIIGAVIQEPGVTGKCNNYFTTAMKINKSTTNGKLTVVFHY